MLAGGADMAADTFGLPAVWGVALVAVPSYIAVAGRQQGVFAAQRFLVPLMLAGLAVVSAASLLQPGAAALPATAAKGQWAVAGSLYVGYNMLGGAALLTGLANNGGKPALRYRAGLLGGALVAVSAILPVAAFLHSGPEVGRYQLPLLYLAYRQSSWLFYVYSFLFAAALISTVIANSYCLCQRFAKPGRPHLLVLTLVLALALPFSQGSFARLVAQVYGACGWAGIAFFAAVALCQLGRGEKSR